MTGQPTVIITEDQIRERVRELAGQISNDYAATTELSMVGVLKGAFIFIADLSRRLTVARTVDFIAVASYGKRGTKSGAVRLLMDLSESVEDKDVLVVEDIVDTGRTLAYLLELIRTRKPASLRTCALVRKKERAEVDVHIDYLGFDIADVWAVGYGLDYAEQYRTLPYIGALEPPNG